MNTQELEQTVRRMHGVVEPETTPTLAEAIPILLEAKRRNGLRPFTLKRMHCYLHQFACGREQMRVGHVTFHHVQEWFQMRQEKAVSQRSNMGVLGSFFSFAVRQGWLFVDPIRRLEKPHIPQRQPKILTVDQCKAILAWTAENSPRHLGWLILTLLVGVRPKSEADLLSWGSINLEHGRIRIEGAQSKTRRHRIIDLAGMAPHAWEWLKLARLMDSELPVVHTGRRRFVKHLRRLLGFEGWPQDLLRHTAGSYLFAHHQDAGRVAAFMGNSAGILLTHYRCLAEKEDAARWMAIIPDQIIKEQKDICTDHWANLI